MPVCVCTVHSSPRQDGAPGIVHLDNLGHSRGFVKLSKSSLSAGINALRLKKWEAELGSMGLMIYRGLRSWEWLRWRRTRSVGLRSQPREAAVCPVMGGQAPRCISSREGYSVWHPITWWGQSCLWGAGEVWMCLGVPLGYRAESARAVALRLCILSLSCPQALQCLGPLVLHPPAAPETYSSKKSLRLTPLCGLSSASTRATPGPYGASQVNGFPTGTFFLKFKKILFLAVLGLGCCVWSFLSCGKQWLLCVVPRELSDCSVFSCGAP